MLYERGVSGGIYDQCSAEATKVVRLNEPKNGEILIMCASIHLAGNMYDFACITTVYKVWFLRETLPSNRHMNVKAKVTMIPYEVASS